MIGVNERLPMQIQTAQAEISKLKKRRRSLRIKGCGFEKIIFTPEEANLLTLIYATKSNDCFE